MTDRPPSQRVQRIRTLTSEQWQGAHRVQLVEKTLTKKPRFQLDRLEAAVVLLSLCISERHHPRLRRSGQPNENR